MLFFSRTDFLRSWLDTIARAVPVWQKYLAVLVFALIGSSIVIAGLSVVTKVLVLMAATVCIWVGGAMLFQYTGQLVPLVTPTLALALAARAQFRLAPSRGAGAQTLHPQRVFKICRSRHRRAFDRAPGATSSRWRTTQHDVFCSLTLQTTRSLPRTPKPHASSR